MTCGALLGTVAFLWAGGAEAAPLGFSLTWDAPAQCPTSDYLRAQVETLLSGAPATLVWVAARAEVSQREDGMWTVRLTTDRGGTVGERSLEADACRSLADATALVVALTIDPAHVASAAARPSDSDPGASIRPSLPAALPVVPVLPAPAPLRSGAPRAPDRASAAAERPSRFELFPAVGGDLGTLPTLAYGFSLAGSLHVGRLRAEVYGAYWPNHTAHPGRVPAGEGGEVELFAGGARGCFPLPGRSEWFHRIELSPCAGLEAGALHGRGLNLPRSLTQTGLWLAVTLDARIVVRLSRALGFVADAGAAVPLRRDAFTLGTGSAAPTIDRPGAIEGRAWAGPELRF
jgi:hypothetical protein